MKSYTVNPQDFRLYLAPSKHQGRDKANSSHRVFSFPCISTSPSEQSDPTDRSRDPTQNAPGPDSDTEERVGPVAMLSSPYLIFSRRKWDGRKWWHPAECDIPAHDLSARWPGMLKALLVERLPTIPKASVPSPNHMKTSTRLLGREGRLRSSRSPSARQYLRPTRNT